MDALASRGESCPCCGTPMVVDSETKTRISLKCPACLVSDVRMK